MFKKRSLQVSVIKANKLDTEVPASRRCLNEAEITLIKSSAKTVATTAVAMVVCMKLTDAACEIATNRFTK